jgi:hypothetical protein
VEFSFDPKEKFLSFFKSLKTNLVYTEVIIFFKLKFRIKLLLPLLGSLLAFTFDVDDEDFFSVVLHPTCFEKEVKIFFPFEKSYIWGQVHQPYGAERKCAGSHSSVPVGAVQFYQQNYAQLHHYAQLENTLIFHAVRSRSCASKIGVNLLAQKLRVKCW